MYHTILAGQNLQVREIRLIAPRAWGYSRVESGSWADTPDSPIGASLAGAKMILGSKMRYGLTAGRDWVAATSK